MHEPRAATNTVLFTSFAPATFLPKQSETWERRRQVRLPLFKIQSELSSYTSISNVSLDLRCREDETLMVDYIPSGSLNYVEFWFGANLNEEQVADIHLIKTRIVPWMVVDMH